MRTACRAATLAITLQTHAHAALAQEAPAAGFTSDAQVNTPEGHTTLRWEPVGVGDEFQVQHGTSAAFPDPELWYEGPATQSFVSGLGEGEHFYRVRAREGEGEPWGAWSDSVEVDVEYQPMWLAATLFSTGAVMFCCIVGFVVWQARAAMKGGRGDG